MLKHVNKFDVLIYLIINNKQIINTRGRKPQVRDGSQLTSTAEGGRGVHLELTKVDEGGVAVKQKSMSTFSKLIRKIKYKFSYKRKKKRV